MFEDTDFELSDLQRWRKLVLGLCIGVWLFLGPQLFFRETDIYGGAPRSPVPEKGQIYPVHAHHRYLRYVTAKEAEDLAFWRNLTPTAMGISVLTMVFVLGTYRKTRPKR